MARMHPRAELGARIEGPQYAERVHLAREDRKEEVEVERLREHRGLGVAVEVRLGRGRARGARRADGEDDRGGEHAGGRERGGLEGDEDDVRERAVEVP